MPNVRRRAAAEAQTHTHPHCRSAAGSELHPRVLLSQPQWSCIGALTSSQLSYRLVKVESEKSKRTSRARARPIYACTVAELHALWQGGALEDG
jgi:hypothetical protein